jgi:hypothetical protein
MIEVKLKLMACCIEWIFLGKILVSIHRNIVKTFTFHLHDQSFAQTYPFVLCFLLCEKFKFNYFHP